MTGNEGLTITTFPTYGEPENGPTDLSAAIEYMGMVETFPLGGRTPESLLSDEYVVIISEREKPTHYRITDGERAYYAVGSIPTVTIREALQIKASFASNRNPLCAKYAFHCVMPMGPAAMDWIRSYMPSKRAPIPKSVREEVYAKCQGRCAYCGKAITIDEMQVDHVESHHRHQGKDEADNYLPACRDCNGLKSDYLLEEFRTVLIPSCAKRSAFHGGQSSRNGRIARAYGLTVNPKRKIVFWFERMKKE